MAQVVMRVSSLHKFQVLLGCEPIYYSVDQTLNAYFGIPGLFPSPNNLHISNANFILKEFTFSWSPVTLDCPAIHYNILASNCGSCPTTTNHTNVTCTDIPTDGSTCVFALQTVVCGIITGELSNQVSFFNSNNSPGQFVFTNCMNSTL